MGGTVFTLTDFLYPRTEFTREYGIPIHDSLVNSVWGYRIPVVHFVSSYVSLTWILYPLLTRRQRRVSSRQHAGRKCKRDFIEVFYQCRTQEGGQMAACSSCGEWFLEDCVALPQVVWTKPDFKWSCASCN